MLAAPGCRVCSKFRLKNPSDFGWKIIYDLLSWGAYFQRESFCPTKMHLMHFYHQNELSKDVLLVSSKVSSHEVSAGNILDHLGGQFVVRFWGKILWNWVTMLGWTSNRQKIWEKSKISNLTKHLVYSFWGKGPFGVHNLTLWGCDNLLIFQLRNLFAYEPSAPHLPKWKTKKLAQRIFQVETLNLDSKKFQAGECKLMESKNPDSKKIVRSREPKAWLKGFLPIGIPLVGCWLKN